jgi:hypothetical protein
VEAGMEARCWKLDAGKQFFSATALSSLKLLASSFLTSFYTVKPTSSFFPNFFLSTKRLQTSQAAT